MLVKAALITNIFINTIILKLSKSSWQKSFYVDVLFTKIGKFSFVLAALAHQAILSIIMTTSKP